MIVERSAAAGLAGLVASLAVACGIAPATPGGDQPIGVRLQVEAKTDSGQPALGTQEMLQTGDRQAVIVNSDRLAVTVNGDRLAVTVTVDQPAYVYVTHSAADGSTRLLFPRGTDDDVLLEAHLALRLPPAGEWLRLDPAVGDDVFLVSASRAPSAAEAGSARGMELEDDPSEDLAGATSVELTVKHSQ